ANAHSHGAAPVELTVDGPVVTVRDHGEGFPAYLLEHGPQRFRTESGGKGHGLGLTIARGQAAVIGAELVLANAPDGGAGQVPSGASSAVRSTYSGSVSRASAPPSGALASTS
ncbi:ATP-binding protein, partial [Streptomyces fradiae]|uniref:ATP-binding protein n=1 Tax=Streptomyces fradiae TaxID=1906 RepID=UPI00358DD1D4